jgi:hypothetical protein
LETTAKLLKLLGGNSRLFSKCALKSLDDQADFDSAMRRFGPSRPSQLILLRNRTLFRRFILNGVLLLGLNVCRHFVHQLIEGRARVTHQILAGRSEPHGLRAALE